MGSAHVHRILRTATASQAPYFPGAAQASIPATTSSLDPGGGEPFLSLQSGFTQSVYGLYSAFFGGITFGLAGEV